MQITQTADYVRALCSRVQYSLMSADLQDFIYSKTFRFTPTMGSCIQHHLAPVSLPYCRSVAKHLTAATHAHHACSAALQALDKKAHNSIDIENACISQKMVKYRL